MIALTGPGGCFHLAKQRVHLFRVQSPARPHRTMAGQGGKDGMQLFFQPFRAARSRVGQIVGQIPQQARQIATAAQQRRHGPDGQATGPERFKFQPQARQCFLLFQQLRRCAIIQRNNLRR